MDEEASPERIPYELIFDSITDAILVIDPNDLTIISANKAAADQVKMVVEEIVGKNCHAVFHNSTSSLEHTEKVCPVVDVVKSEQSVTTEHTHYDVEGNERRIETTAYPVKNSKGKIVRVINVYKDITERKKAEDALLDANERWGSLTENTDDVIMIVDSEGIIQYTNQPVPPYTPEEVIGTSVYEYIPREQHDIKSESLRKVFEEGKVDRYEISSFIPDTGIMWFSTKIIPIKRDGKVMGAIEIVSDITKHKQIEEALKEYSETLEETVEQRTKELREAQEELVRQEKLAVLGQLAGGVGHELRNPLGAIKNAAYFINMALDEPEPDVKESLEILERELAKSERIITSLLDFARAKPPSRRKIDVEDIVHEALSRVVMPENVKVVSQLDETLLEILADPDQLDLVFGNIILNAIQAMPEGGQLTIKSEEHKPDWVTVSFADTGVGIPEENLGKLFEPLFTTKAKGIGLGLAITKTMVEAHGGTIEAESTVGEGTTFTVKLPLGHVEGDRDE
jgi:PAS domain S-box-containing protein